MKMDEDHPELMQRITRDIQSHPIYTELTAITLQSEMPPPDRVNEDGDYAIDRRKNLETILAFLKVNNSSAEFEKELKKLLLQHMQ